MQTSVKWTAAGTLSLGLLALPLVALLPLPEKILAQTARAPWVVPWPSTRTQTALREAAVWWALAVQCAHEATDEAREALRRWDPAAPFEEREARRQFMRADADGYLARVRAAIQKAERLVQTPAERQRVQVNRRKWEAAVGSF